MCAWFPRSREPIESRASDVGRDALEPPQSLRCCPQPWVQSQSESPPRQRATRTLLGRLPSTSPLRRSAATRSAGSLQTATAGSWKGGQLSFSYRWQRCDATGSSCAAIPGGTTTHLHGGLRRRRLDAPHHRHRVEPERQCFCELGPVGRDHRPRAGEPAASSSAALAAAASTSASSSAAPAGGYSPVEHRPAAGFRCDAAGPITFVDTGRMERFADLVFLPMAAL